ncbi:hypothetical protein NUM3379_33000 [Kineococcus sp. NUM-3379]
MRIPDEAEEQVRFWRRHLWSGVALCVVLPALFALSTWLSPDAAHPLAVYVLAAAVAGLSPLLLRVPVERLVRSPRGHWFFDAWEALGIALITAFCLLDGGVGSPFVMSFFVCLAHAALAYPPLGMVIAGCGNVLGYLVVAGLGGHGGTHEVLPVVLTLVVATATCAFASSNHVRLNRRTAAIAQQLAVLAERDGLTGCLNHRAFHEEVHRAVAAAAPGAPVGLLLVDVDHFKQVNDTSGHQAGDAALALIGGLLRGTGRDGDLAGRLGGDEFALLLPGAGPAEVLRVAERVAAEVRPHGLTVSVGAASTDRPCEVADLLAAADRAVYRAKRAGRDGAALEPLARDAGTGCVPAGPAPQTVPARWGAVGGNPAAS